MKKINIKSVITGFVFACCLPASVHALAEGWTMVPREPALDPDIDVNKQLRRNAVMRNVRLTILFISGEITVSFC